jgi:hypothetical protein
MNPCTIRCLAAAALAATWVAPAAAQSVGFTGSYSQSFDTLPAAGAQTLVGRGPHAFSALSSFSIGGLDGWYFSNPGGSSTSTEFRAQDGSLAGGDGRGVVSFGSNGSGERALGGLATSNQIGSFGIVLTNNSGATIDALDIAFDGEQWRRGDRTGVPNTLGFEWALASSIGGSGFTSFAPLSFSSVVTSGATNTALDGNAAANRAAVFGTLTGLNWGAGQTLALRWTINDISGQDDGLAIDNFSVSAVPEPGLLAMMLSGLAVLGGVARRRTRI